jgi:hypothetical protein
MMAAEAATCNPTLHNLELRSSDRLFGFPIVWFQEDSHHVPVRASNQVAGISANRAKAHAHTSGVRVRKIDARHRERWS